MGTATGELPKQKLPLIKHLIQQRYKLIQPKIDTTTKNTGNGKRNKENKDFYSQTRDVVLAYL